MSTKVTQVDDLATGDRVRVHGNGINTTREVTAVDEDSWKDGRYARLSGTDVAYRLKEKRDHPLQTGDAMHLNGVGTVAVERIDPDE